MNFFYSYNLKHTRATKKTKTEKKNFKNWPRFPGCPVSQNAKHINPYHSIEFGIDYFYILKSIQNDE